MDLKEKTSKYVACKVDPLIEIENDWKMVGESEFSGTIKVLDNLTGEVQKSITVSFKTEDVSINDSNINDHVKGMKNLFKNVAKLSESQAKMKISREKEPE